MRDIQRSDAKQPKQLMNELFGGMNGNKMSAKDLRMMSILQRLYGEGE